jgi:hypothetical protein
MREVPSLILIREAKPILAGVLRGFTKVLIRAPGIVNA